MRVWIVAYAIDAHMRGSPHAGHAHAHHAHRAAHAAPTSLASQGSKGVGSELIAGLMGAPTKKAIDILADMATEQKKYFGSSTDSPGASRSDQHGEYLDGCVDKSQCDPYVAQHVVDNTLRKAYTLMFGTYGAPIAHVKQMAGSSPAQIISDIKTRWNDHAKKSDDSGPKETANTATWGFANVPWSMQTIVAHEDKQIKRLAGQMNDGMDGLPNGYTSIPTYKRNWEAAIEGVGGSTTSVAEELHTVAQAHATRKSDFLMGTGSDPDKSMSDNSISKKKTALLDVLKALVGNGDGTGAINDIRTAGDQAIHTYWTSAAKYLAGQVGDPDANGNGKLVEALTDLGNSYRECAKERVMERREDYLGKAAAEPPDLTDGLAQLHTGGEGGFGKGGLSKRAFDDRKKLKDAQRQHMEAAQAYAAMGAEMLALINSAKRKVTTNLAQFKAQTRRDDKRAEKKWFDALDGRTGAFPLLKNIMRSSVAEAMSANDGGFKDRENEYLDARTEQQQIQEGDFRDARTRIGKATQQAIKANTASENLDERVKAAHSLLNEETKLASDSGDYISDFKDTMAETVEDESEQVPELFNDVKLLGDTASNDVTTTLGQYGREAKEEVSTTFNDVAHKLRAVREDQEKTFKQYVDRIKKLVKPENGPAHAQLQSLRKTVQTLEEMLGKEKDSVDGSNYRDEKLNKDVAAHEALLKRNLDDQVKQVELELTRLGSVVPTAGGTSYAPDSDTSKVGLAWSELSQAEKEWADPATQEGRLKNYAGDLAKEINKQVYSYQTKMGHVISKEQEVKGILGKELTKADAVDKQLDAMLSSGGTLKKQENQVSNDVAGFQSEAENAAKQVQAGLLNANQALDADIESAVTDTATKADSTAASVTGALKTDLGTIETQAKSTVADSKALKTKSDKTLEQLEEGGGDVEEGRLQASNVVEDATHRQAANKARQEQQLKGFEDEQNRRVQELTEAFTALKNEIPERYGKTYEGAKKALEQEARDVEADLVGANGRLAANKQAVAQMALAAGDAATAELHDVTLNDQQGEARVKQATSVLDGVTKRYSEEELGALAQADVLYRELDTVREDLSAAGILGLKGKEAQLAALAEREKLTLEKLHSVTSEMDEYARAQVTAAVTKSNKLIGDILKNEELSDEEKQKQIEELEMALQSEITSVVGSGTDAEKTLHLLGMKIDDDAKTRVKEQLKESAAVQEGLSDEAKERAAQGGDDNAVLESRLTDAEKITAVLSQVESSAGAMLHGQETRWQAKLAHVTEQLSHQLGKDLKVGVDEVKELAGQAVNNSDRLAYEISADRRQLESAVKGMSNDLATSQAYIDAHVAEEQKEVEALQRTVPDGVEKPMKQLATKLDGIFQDASHMHIQIQGSMAAAAHDGQETEEALEKAAEFEVEDEDAAKAFVPKAHELLARHAQTAGWFAAYEAGDLIFKRAVAKKLAELGHEVNMEGLEGASRLSTDDLDAELSQELDANQKRMAKQLNAMYADSDAQIAKLRADSSLSAEERARRIAEIEAENRKKASQMFAEQEQMKQRQAALEGALAKYQTKVAQAEQVAQAAVAAGVLSPSAIDSSRKLASANVALARVRMKPLFSAIELRSFGVSPDELSRYVDHLGKLHKANSILAKKDADLQARVEHLERILQA